MPIDIQSMGSFGASQPILANAAKLPPIPQRKPTLPGAGEADGSILDQIFDFGRNTFRTGLDTLDDFVQIERLKILNRISANAQKDATERHRSGEGTSPVLATGASFSPALGLILAALAMGILLRGN